MSLSAVWVKGGRLTIRLQLSALGLLTLIGLAVTAASTLSGGAGRVPLMLTPHAYLPAILRSEPTAKPSSTPVLTLTPSPTLNDGPTLTLTLSGNSTSTPKPAPTATPLFRFALIGDYGLADQSELDVANLVMSWKPDFIVTLGDNNYYLGQAATIDQNIGQYYHGFIFPYLGNYGDGADTNRFFPAPGNHDWYSPSGLQPYLDYFTLPGNERYYDFTWGEGLAHFFIVDSDDAEPDGITAASIQAQWLQTQLSLSTAAWDVVVMHHAPYSSSSRHGSTPELQWPYQAWGADVVLAGHDHVYERLDVNGLPYFVNGLGGNPALYDFADPPLPESRARFNGDWGAQLVEVYPHLMVFTFITRANQVIESYGVLPDSAADPRGVVLYTAPDVVDNGER